jgi:hypothetical protein
VRTFSAISKAVPFLGGLKRKTAFLRNHRPCALRQDLMLLRVSCRLFQFVRKLRLAIREDLERQDQELAFPNLYDAFFSSFSARNQSCSGEPSGQPRSAQYFSAKRAISSREGAGVSVCFFAAGFRFLGAPFAASPLLVVIPISLVNTH